ncbi:uncharacterized protein AMSG_02919, partial [Thecamonas trahens ATCC 50062]
LSLRQPTMPATNKHVPSKDLTVTWSSMSGGLSLSTPTGTAETILVFLVLTWLSALVVVTQTDALIHLSKDTLVPLNWSDHAETLSTYLAPYKSFSVTQACATTMVVTMFFDTLRLVFAETDNETRTCTYLVLINFVALTTYVSMLMEFDRSFWLNPETGVVTNVRRMLSWIVSTPLIVTLSCSLASADLRTLIRMIAIDVVMVLTGIMCSLASHASALFWITSVTSFAAFGLILLEYNALFRRVTSKVTVRGEGSERDVRAIQTVLIVTNLFWLAFPTSWTLEHAGYISGPLSEKLLAVADIGAKCVLSVVLAHTNLASVWRREVLNAMRSQIVKSSEREVLSALTHELQTPLHGIVASVELLKNMKLDAEQSRISAVIEKSGKLLSNTLKDMFVKGGVIADEIAPSVVSRPFNIADLFESVVGFSASASLARGIDIISLIDDECNVTATGNNYVLEHLSMALVTYLSNQPDTTMTLIEVTLEDNFDVPPELLAESLPGAEWSTLVCSISSTGAGMRESDLTAAIESLSDPRTDLGRCYELTQTLSGDLGIRSQYGIGTAVFFTIPIQIERAVVRPPSIMDAAGDVDILIVHPVELMCISLARCFDAPSVNITWATSPDDLAAAINTAFRKSARDTAFKFALIDESVMQSAPTIRRLTQDMHIPIVALVNPFSPTTAKRPRGIKARIRKPVTLLGLRNVFANLTERFDLGAAAGRSSKKASAKAKAKASADDKGGDADSDSDEYMGSATSRISYRPVKSRSTSLVTSDDSDGASTLGSLDLTVDTLDSSITGGGGAGGGWSKVLSDRLFQSILVADDSLINIMIAQSMLEQGGFSNIDTAVNGEEAVELYEQSVRYDYPISFVLMDCNMPVMDGYTAVRSIRALEKEAGSRRTPVIAFTANVSEENRRLCAEADMDLFLTKPFEIDDLRILAVCLLADVSSPPDDATRARFQQLLLHPDGLERLQLSWFSS